MRTRIAQVIERRARDPEVRIPVQVQIFLLRSDNITGGEKTQRKDKIYRASSKQCGFYQL